jgi:ribonuclease E
VPAEAASLPKPPRGCSCTCTGDGAGTRGAPLDLNAVLGSAGLTLAATDPEKLRLAQEAAAKAVAPVASRANASHCRRNRTSR